MKLPDRRLPRVEVSPFFSVVCVGFDIFVYIEDLLVKKKDMGESCMFSILLYEVLVLDKSTLVGFVLRQFESSTLHRHHLFHLTGSAESLLTLN